MLTELTRIPSSFSLALISATWCPFAWNTTIHPLVLTAIGIFTIQQLQRREQEYTYIRHALPICDCEFECECEYSWVCLRASASIHTCKLAPVCALLFTRVSHTRSSLVLTCNFACHASHSHSLVKSSAKYLRRIANDAMLCMWNTPTCVAMTCSPRV